MALNKAGLKARILDGGGLVEGILTGLEAQGFFPDNQYSKLAVYMGVLADKLAEAVANSVIDEIMENAVVNTTVSVASVGGVTAGAGVSGPGAGTGLGTIA